MHLMELHRQDSRVVKPSWHYERLQRRGHLFRESVVRIPSRFLALLQRSPKSTWQLATGRVLSLGVHVESKFKVNNHRLTASA